MPPRAAPQRRTRPRYAEAVEHAQLKIEEEGPPSEFPELSFDPNAMAAMFQDPNMVQLMASLFTAKEKQATQGPRGAGVDSVP